MLSLRIALFYLFPFLATASKNASSPRPGTNTVNLRIEADSSTLYEGPITSGPRNITLPCPELTGGPITISCEGKLYPAPGNTPTDALDEAAKLKGFTYNGTYDPDINDFYITRISTSETLVPAGSNKFWGQLVNYQVSTFPEHLTLCGCQQQVQEGDEVLWFYIEDRPAAGPTDGILFLKLAPTAVKVKQGKGFTVTVTDGRTGTAVQNASVDGVHTDSNGKATLYFFETGFFQFKAHQPGNVRSNVMNVTVTK